MSRLGRAYSHAPGAYTGNAVKTLPAVRENIEEKKWQAADAGIVTVGKVLEAEASTINAAAEELEKTTEGK